ncbi:hypothetical protein cypCar_00037970 [Cyprinus carpio]|nr:hypothetical protein cypCar_00037970 [Cyprinus carpio]
MVLLKNEAIYADPYSLVQDPRFSVASPQALAYRRGSVRSVGGYPAAALQCELEGALYRERMEAMEKQIASLTGLVQSVLTRGPDSP